MMNAHPQAPLMRPRVELLLLHPTGSRDPQWTSLAVGVLQWIRHGCAARGLHGSLWPETAVDAQGNRRMILRELPWTNQEIRRKLNLVPTAEAVLTLHHGSPEGELAQLTLEDRRGDRLVKLELPFKPERLHATLPDALDTVLHAMDRAPYGRSPSDILHTSDPVTTLASLHALERVVAFEVGVGREDLLRLFEPALQCLERDAGHPTARECLIRLGGAVLALESPDAPKAVRAVYERWSKIEPLSPLPSYYMALLCAKTGEQEAARAAFDETLRRDPLFGPALQEYAVWLAQRGFLEQGVSILHQAFGRTEVGPGLMDQAGCILANAGRLAEAEPLFRASIAADGPPTAYANLARCLLGLGREEESLAVLQQGLSASLDRSQIDVLAQIAGRTGLAAANARALLRGRVVEGSDDEGVLLELAARSQELFPESATTLARRLLEVATHPESRRFAHYVLLKERVKDLDERWDGAAREAIEGDPKLAESFFREMLELEPDFGRGHFLLACALDRQGRLGEALPHVERAVEGGEGDDSAVLDLLARARAEAGDLPAAAQAHHQAASLARQNPRILRNAAVTLLRAGYLDEGMGMAGASLALDPQQDELRDLLRQAAARRPGASRGMRGKLRGLLGKLPASRLLH